MNLTGRHNNNIEWSGRKVWSLTLHQAAPPTDFYLLQDVFTILETKECYNKFNRQEQRSLFRVRYFL